VIGVLRCFETAAEYVRFSGAGPECKASGSRPCTPGAQIVRSRARIRSAVRVPSPARGQMSLRSALGGEVMPDVPIQSQVRLGLSNETEMVPPGTMVMWATSWKLMALPSEPVAWAENVNVAFAFC
jgi:hypothetical protein